VDNGSVDDIATIDHQRRPQAKSGWVNVSDGDQGRREGEGFYHQEFLGEGSGVQTRDSDQFRLPAGTACGFHETQNFAGKHPPKSQGTCMGMDPGVPVRSMKGEGNCPIGWIARRHFDSSSDNGYFVWCEYTDPHNLCDPDCLQVAIRTVTVGIQSNTDDTGGTKRPECPPPTTRSHFFDDGRHAGNGLSFCSNLVERPSPPPSSGSLVVELDICTYEGFDFTLPLAGQIKTSSGVTSGESSLPPDAKIDVHAEPITTLLPTRDPAPRRTFRTRFDRLQAGSWKIEAHNPNQIVIPQDLSVNATVPGQVTLYSNCP
jgi:hypothetical protein